MSICRRCSQDKPDVSALGYCAHCWRNAPEIFNNPISILIAKLMEDRPLRAKFHEERLQRQAELEATNQPNAIITAIKETRDRWLKK